MHRRPLRAGAPSFARRLGLDLGIVAVLLLAAVPLVAGGQEVATGRIDVGTGALLYLGGGFTVFGAPDPPASADLVSMSLVPGGDGSYAARLSFAGRFKQVRQRNGPAEHVVFVSLQPPDGPRQRVILRADGTAGVDVAEQGAFVPAGPAEVAIEGRDVVLQIPAGVGLTPEWEVQPHVFLIGGDRNGFHDHGPQVPVGALTGERDPSTVPASRTGTRIETGQPAYWKLGQPFPAGFRPRSYGLEWTAEGHLVAVVDFDQPPQDIGEFRGKAVLAQVVQVHLGEDPQDRFGGLFVSYDVATGNSVVLDARDPANPTPLGSASVEASGTQVRIDLGPPGDGTSPAAFLPDVPPDAGPLDAQAEATSTEAGCQSPVSFDVTMGIANGQLQIGHQDGDVASGPADDSGPVQADSPAGRTYAFPTIAGTRLMATHGFSGCTYTVVFTLPQPLVDQGGTPSSSPPPGPQETITILPIGPGTVIQFNFTIYDETGNGLGSNGPSLPLLDLAGPPPGTSTEEPTEEPTTDEPPSTEPPVVAPPASDTGGSFPVVPVVGGALGAAAVATIVYKVTRKRGSCTPEELALLMAKLMAARAAAARSQAEIDDAQNDLDSFEEAAEAAKSAGMQSDENVAAGKAERTARLEAAKKAKEAADALVKQAELDLAACRCKDEVAEYQAARDELLAAKGTMGKGLEHKEYPLLQDPAAGWAQLLKTFEDKGSPGAGASAEDTQKFAEQTLGPQKGDPASAAASARLMAAWTRYKAAKGALEACLGLPTGPGGGPGGGADPIGDDTPPALPGPVPPPPQDHGQVM